MKKFLTSLFLLAFCFGIGQKSQATNLGLGGSPTGRYTNLAFAYSNFKQENYPSLKSDYGFSLIKGTTYYLHKPIAGLLRFGIDATWTDITYTNYKVNEYYSLYEEPEKYSINQIDVALGAGLSATVNMFKHFQASLYFRYNPTFQMLLNHSEFEGGFANMFSYGLNATYYRVGVGIEGRFGKAKTKTYLDLSDIEDAFTGTTRHKISTSLSGLRAYICFRF